MPSKNGNGKNGNGKKNGGKKVNGDNKSDAVDNGNDCSNGEGNNDNSRHGCQMAIAKF